MNHQRDNQEKLSLSIRRFLPLLDDRADAAAPSPTRIFNIERSAGTLSRRQLSSFYVCFSQQHLSLRLLRRELRDSGIQEVAPPPRKKKLILLGPYPPTYMSLWPHNNFQFCVTELPQFVFVPFVHLFILPPSCFSLLPPSHIFVSSLLSHFLFPRFPFFLFRTRLSISLIHCVSPSVRMSVRMWVWKI